MRDGGIHGACSSSVPKYANLLGLPCHLFARIDHGAAMAPLADACATCAVDTGTLRLPQRQLARHDPTLPSLEEHPMNIVPTRRAARRPGPHITWHQHGLPQAFAAVAVLGLALAAADASWAGQPGRSAASAEAIARGGYLVKALGCADCHTPMKLGPKGPEPDLSRGLSGHPHELELPPAPSAQGPWQWGGAASNTAFWGPWGVSFAANLSSDRATGIGAWRDEDFIASMRQGKHVGGGRPLLPPMPWPAIGQLNDRDLRAMLAYLKSQPAVSNAVPQPRPPSTAVGVR